MQFPGRKDFRAFGRYDEYLLETENGYLPNIEFLHGNVHLKMQYLADAGLVIAAGYSWADAIEPKNRLERYCLLAKYLVARDGAYPMIWTLAGELPGYGSAASCQYLAGRWREIALETQKWDGYGHLRSAHYATNTPMTDTYYNEDWFDFVMAQSGHGDFRIDSDVYTDFHKTYRGKPFVESEALYEDITSNKSVQRSRT